MSLNQRQVHIGVMLLATVGNLLILVNLLVTAGNSGTTITTVIGIVSLTALLLAYWRNWDPARYLFILVSTLLLAVGIQEPFLSERTGYEILLPALLSLVLAGPVWIIGSSLLALLVIVARGLATRGESAYIEPFAAILLGMIIGAMVLSRLVTDGALTQAEENAHQAEANADQLSLQARELTRRAAELEQRTIEQEQLLGLVATLETPAVALATGVLLVPIVGHLDSRRVEALIARTLQAVAAQRSKLVILDVAGVSVVDTQVAHALLRAVQALRLLGCNVTITGISASVATTIIQLGVSMKDVRIARTPQEALEQMIDV
jgi:anti-anti-sigma regulatory factor/outer membrane murein-binding lipoprotein Lpp